MQESFWWWQCSDSYIISLFPTSFIPPPPFSLSLISLMVSVDVKHHVYLLLYVMANARGTKRVNICWSFRWIVFPSFTFGTSTQPQRWRHESDHLNSCADGKAQTYCLTRSKHLCSSKWGFTLPLTDRFKQSYYSVEVFFCWRELVFRSFVPSRPVHPCMPLGTAQNNLN